MLAAANATWPAPDLMNQDNHHQLYVLAAALTGQSQKARNGIAAALPTFNAATTNGALSLGRQLPAYVIAADVINLQALDPALDATFRADLAAWRNNTVGTHGRWFTLSGTFADSSNNWGAHAGAAVIAIDAYLGRSLTADYDLFREYMGTKPIVAPHYPQPDSTPSWASTWFVGSSWIPVQQVAGDPRDGAVTEDAWRSGAYPTISPTYVMDSAQSLALQAELLSRAGFAAWPQTVRYEGFLARSNWATIWTTSGGRGGRGLAYLYNRHGLSVSLANVGDRQAWSLAWMDWLYPAGGPSPSPTPTPTPSPSPTPSPTPAPSPTPSPTPSPGGCGTSLQARVDAAAAGSAINLTGCTYTTSATISKALTILGGTLRQGGTGLTISGSDVTIDGMTFDGGNNTIRVSGDRDTIIRSSFINMHETSIRLNAGGTDDLLLQDNTISQTLTNGGAGYSPISANDNVGRSARLTVRGNTIRNGPDGSVAHFGVEVWGITGLIIEGNHFSGYGPHISIPRSDGAIVRNNDFDITLENWATVELADIDDAQVIDNVVIGDQPTGAMWQAFVQLSAGSGGVNRISIQRNRVTNYPALLNADGAGHTIIDNCLQNVSRIYWGSFTGAVSMANNGPCP